MASGRITTSTVSPGFSSPWMHFVVNSWPNISTTAVLIISPGPALLSSFLAWLLTLFTFAGTKLALPIKSATKWDAGYW